jgi:hypothetical protein
MQAVVFLQKIDENGYKEPTDFIPNMMICPHCNLLNFVTDEITDCRFCGKDKLQFEILVEQVYEKNIKKLALYRKPRIAESKLCKVCNREHRKH